MMMVSNYMCTQCSALSSKVNMFLFEAVAKVSIFATIKISGAMVDFPVAKVCCKKEGFMLYVLQQFNT